MPPHDGARKHFTCCGVRIDGFGPRSAARAIIEVAGTPAAIHLCNAFTLSLAMRDAGFRDCLNAGNLNFADGAPVAAVGRRRGLQAMTSRVYGPTLMFDVLKEGTELGVRHYFYGSTPEVIDALTASLNDRVPGVKIVGSEAPPFRPLTDDERHALADRVHSSGADIMWVGLGTPKQDLFVEQNRDLLGVPLVAVGAAFDFHAGTKRMAPAWVQRFALEWLFRLVTEPRRLWKRYLIGNSIFLYGVGRDEVANRRQRS